MPVYCQCPSPSFARNEKPVPGGTAKTLKVDSWCTVIRKDAIQSLRKRDNTASIEVVVTLALGGKALDSNEEIFIVQHDSAKRQEAVVRQLILQGLQMTQAGRFAEFALVHGTHGPSLGCDWLVFESTPEGGRVSFRHKCEYVEGLEDFASDDYHPAWIPHVGHGFMLASDDEYDVWLDFYTGRTIVNLKMSAARL